MTAIGVSFPGDPSDPASWSGTPLGVMEGLRACGVEPVPINVQPERTVVREVFVTMAALGHIRFDTSPRAMISRARHSAMLSASFGRLQTQRGRSVLRKSPNLAGIVQIGSSYQFNTDLPIVTFEDMTVRQAYAEGFPALMELRPRAIERRVEAQRGVYDRAVACAVMTPWAARSVIEDYGITPSKVHVTGVGNNHPCVAHVPRDWTRPRFLFVGRDWSRKNGHAVVQAFIAVKKEFPSAQLDLVGGHPAVEEEGIVGHGVLSLSDPADRAVLTELFSTATTLVVPSLFEPAGIVYVEAASAGVPSICSDRGGAAFLVGKGGTVVRSGDGGALTEAMRKHCDAVVVESLGTEAQRHSTMFSWTAVAERLLRALQGQPPTNYDQIGSALR